ncbi:MAG: pyruvate kinase [Candidatus Terrybacteria bacterium RIFCSPHIGHO2_01_FULL_48_17]|uniref:Pyruvate kinase n=1 Tax=Candidatus Terrybacteria bacterium RIFCSPHIGHO2_01_FULL_48_17 TaxID=1802362 RepID=A0A1G2PIF3_9BACT|nr:MAG: pyruvate kinase [Candidatus Terrybacteria bacterium RIFCSPHIGHO2_01_FULL_48_17]OHA53913.1 MAG: pyruvate kinase [Candidatus Terrybacteria bacterium RIFCSPLOWO2_01_FULL_48_14]
MYPKILATLGPHSSDERTIRAMFEAGCDAVRLNLAHDTQAAHAERIARVRQIAEELHKPIAILCDLGGPKARIGKVASGAYLKEGSVFYLSKACTQGNEQCVSVNFPKILDELLVGMIVWLDDGTKKLVVEGREKDMVRLRVLDGGELRDNVGIAVEGLTFGLDSFTQKDERDLSFVVKHAVDFVAVSFVRTPRDIELVREKVPAQGPSLIAKIETPQAVANAEGIAEAADGIMVARGDLGLTLPFDEVPAVQERLVRICLRAGKPVIVATQMLESMIRSPRPTRAEVENVAHAAMQGADALMLSAETARGIDPARVVATMQKIAGRFEYRCPQQTLDSLGLERLSGADTVSAMVVEAAEALDAKLLVAFTETGRAAQRIARFRPKKQILAVSPNEATARKLALTFGVKTKVVPPVQTIEEAVEVAKHAVRELGLLKTGDCFLISAGRPFGASSTTNSMLIEYI